MAETVDRKTRTIEVPAYSDLERIRRSQELSPKLFAHGQLLRDGDVHMDPGLQCPRFALLGESTSAASFAVREQPNFLDLILRTEHQLY